MVRIRNKKNYINLQKPNKCLLKNRLKALSEMHFAFFAVLHSQMAHCMYY